MNFFVCTIFAVPSITVAYLALGGWGLGLCWGMHCLATKPKHFLMCQVRRCANKVNLYLSYSSSLYSWTLAYLLNPMWNSIFHYSLAKYSFIVGECWCFYRALKGWTSKTWIMLMPYFIHFYTFLGTQRCTFEYELGFGRDFRNFHSIKNYLRVKLKG